jgi:hypothetical protein
LVTLKRSTDERTGHALSQTAAGQLAGRGVRRRLGY